MHLLIGFVNVILGRTMASIYRLTHLEFFGRAAIRRCCAAFIAGAGIDDEAMAIIRSMGADGLRLLECEAQSAGERSIAQFVWNILRSLP